MSTIAAVASAEKMNTSWSSSHFVTIDKSGNLYTCGSNSFGQLGIGSLSPSSVTTPQLINNMGALAGKTFKSVIAGQAHTLVLCTDGTLCVFGNGQNGRLGNNSDATVTTPMAINSFGALAGKTPVHISSSTNHSIVVCSDGTVVTFGNNDNGQLGNGTTTESWIPVAINSYGALAGKTAVRADAGFRYSMVLCSDGTIVGFGQNNHYQYGIGTNGDSYIPVAINSYGDLSGRTVSHFCCSYAHSAILCTDGSICMMGRNDEYHLGTGNTNYLTVPTRVNSNGALAGKTPIYVDLAGSYSIVLCSDGSIITFGTGYSGLGYPGRTRNELPTLVSTTGNALENKTPVSITGSAGSTTIVLCSDGTLVGFGELLNMIGIGTNISATPLASTAFLLNVETGVVTPTNSAPVLTAGNTIALPSIPIDPVLSENNGRTVASIIIDLSANYSDNNVSDPRGIAIVSVPDASYGMLQYKLASTWIDISNVSSSAGLLLDASASIRFAPASGVTGFFTFTFKAWDKSTGTVGTLADTTYSASGAFSQNTATGTVTVAQPIRVDIIAQVIVPSSQNIATVTQTLTTTNVLSDPSFASVVAAESSTPVENLTASVQLTEVEYTPVIAPSISGTISVPDISEGIVDVINTGFTVQQALNIFGANYIDTNSTVNKGLLITGINAANGTWQYKVDASWVTVALSGDEVIPLLPSAYIRFVPSDDNIYGVQNISVKAWNTYDGTNGTKVSLTSLANNTYSSSVATINMNVANVNDRPRLVAPIDVRIPTITSSITDASNVGITVASIYTTIGSAYSEVDPEPNVKGLALTGFSAVGWQFKESGSSWTAYTATDASAGLVALVSSTGSIRFMPSSTAVVGGFTATYKLWDQVQGTAGTKVALSTLGESYSIGNGRITTVVAPNNNNLVYGVNMTFNIKGIDNTSFITNQVKQKQLAGLFADALATDRRKVAFSSFKYIINQNGEDVYQNPA